MFDGRLVAERFEQGRDFNAFIGTFQDPSWADRWRQRHEQITLGDDRRRIVESFTRVMHVLCMTGPWCGDCALQGAAMARIAEANPDRVLLRFLNRDEHPDLQAMVRVNLGDRVPMTFFMAEDMAPVSLIGDRTLSRYRAMARKALESSAPAMGPAQSDPLGEVLGEVLAEFERVHLLLRLSGRLRRLHGD